MKTFYSLLLLLPVLFTACKKNSDPEPEAGKKYKVTFKTQLFDQTTTDFKTGSAHVSEELMPKLYVRVYDLDNGGEKVLDYDTLLPGDYVAIFVASNHKFYRLSDFGEEGAGTEDENYFEHAHIDIRESVALESIPLEEIFYKKLYFTVSNEDIEETVVLKRIVAGLEVILEDILPPDAFSRIEVSIPDNTSFYFQDDNRTGSVMKISSFEKGSAIRAFVLGTGQRTVEIRAYDGEDKLVAQNWGFAVFQENKKTVLKGKLFSPKLFTFNLSLDTNWDNPPVVIPF